MDTRQKIGTLETLRDSLSCDAWTVVAGRFNPITTELAEELHGLSAPGRKLLVVVQKSEDELLTLNARAVMAAALRAVDAVLIESSDEWRRIINANTAARVVEDSSREQRREREFRESVLNRNAGAGV